MKRFVTLFRRMAGTQHLQDQVDECLQLLRRRAGGPAGASDPAWRGTGLDKMQQLLLAGHYAGLVRAGGPPPDFRDIGFSSFSQNGEDGILLLLFALIGATDRRVVEICCGDGVQCNAANLVVNHGWTGLLVDGNADLIAKARRFYGDHPSTCLWPPALRHAWVTRTNVNELIAGEGIAGSVDLLSLDLDGVDYWIWRAIDVIQPRVVLLEYQDILGPERCVTVPYADDFAAAFSAEGPDYCGASLAAFVKLGREKGYRLAGVEHYGFNAFFLRNDVAPGLFPEVPVAACFSHPKVVAGMAQRWPRVAGKRWVEV